MGCQMQRQHQAHPVLHSAQFSPLQWGPGCSITLPETGPADKWLYLVTAPSCLEIHSSHCLQICQWHKKSCICLSNGQESHLYWNRILGFGQEIGFRPQAFPDTQMFVLPALHACPAPSGCSHWCNQRPVVERKEGR